MWLLKKQITKKWPASNKFYLIWKKNEIFIWNWLYFYLKFYLNLIWIFFFCHFFVRKTNKYYLPPFLLILNTVRLEIITNRFCIVYKSHSQTDLHGNKRVFSGETTVLIEQNLIDTSLSSQLITRVFIEGNWHLRAVRSSQNPLQSS